MTTSAEFLSTMDTNLVFALDANFDALQATVNSTPSLDFDQWQRWKIRREQLSGTSANGSTSTICRQYYTKSKVQRVITAAGYVNFS